MFFKSFPKSLKKNRNFLVFYEKSRLASFFTNGQFVLFIQRASLPLRLLSQWREIFLASELHFPRSAGIFKQGTALAPLATTGHLVLHFSTEDGLLKMLGFFAEQPHPPILVALCYKGIFLNLLSNKAPYAFLVDHAKMRFITCWHFCEKLLVYSFGFTSFFLYFSYFSFFIIVLLNHTLALITLTPHLLSLRI